jgi:hypothetical protein
MSMRHNVACSLAQYIAIYLSECVLPSSENRDFIITVRTTNHLYKMCVAATVEICLSQYVNVVMLAVAIIACLLFDIPISWTLRLDDCSSDYAEII